MNLLHKKSGCRIFTYDIIFVTNFSLQKVGKITLQI